MCTIWRRCGSDRLAQIEAAKQADGVFDPLSIYIENS